MDAQERQIVKETLVWAVLGLSTIMDGLWIGEFGVPYTGVILLILFFVCFSKFCDKFCSWLWDTYRPISWHIEQVKEEIRDELGRI